jgi:hypothetical protein
MKRQPKQNNFFFKQSIVQVQFLEILGAHRSVIVRVKKKYTALHYRTISKNFKSL